VWSFVKYDMLNRVALTGEVGYTENRLALQSAVNSVTAEDKRTVSRNGNDYTISNNPTGINIGMAHALTVHYYDSYGFGRPSETTPSGYATAPAGLATGSRSRVLGGTNWVRNVIYYDSEYRVLQTIRDLYDIPGSTSPTEWTTTEYDGNYFSKVNKEIVQHKGLTNSTTNTIENSYCYDHTLRLKKTALKLNNLAEVTLNYFVYNELGQVIKKSVGKKAGGNYVDETSLQYNINGSPTRLTSTKFSQEIYYEKRKNYTNGYFAGNISEMYWQNGSSGMKNYTYQYDNLNRLTSANSSNFQYEEKGITYDANGNIKTLQRTWNGTSLIDNLSYTYTNDALSNKLANVNDQSDNNTGYKGGASSYGYDPNGNILTDASRGITSAIGYNLLDMVETVSVNSKNLRYTYSADGEKLKYEEVGTSTKTVYAGAAEYGNTGYLTRLETAEGFITYNSSNSTFSFFYNLTDYLGNVRIVLDENGNAVQTNEYLPFGMVVSSDASPYSGKNKYFYQGKEMQAEQLWYDFHARMYDPAVGRFNGVDPQSQFASPYVGMGNNPVVGVDPDGEWVKMAIGAAISAVSYTASVAFSKGGFDNWNWKQFGVSVAVEAISGAVASGIGDATSQITNVYARGATQAVLHGHVGGVMSGLQGGSYKSGFLTGAASSTLGSVTSKLGPLGQIGTSTIFGGAVAEFSGGDFWRGAAQSAIVAGLNHAAHGLEGTDSEDGTPDKKVYSSNLKDRIEQGWKIGDPYYPASGAIEPDYSLEKIVVGGIGFKGAGKLVPSSSTIAKIIVKNEGWLNKGNWWRLGKGFNPHTQSTNIRLAWGAHPKYVGQVSKTLQPVNKWIRSLGDGHYHFKFLKP
jgi:RHS repeat-associated protein